MSSTSFSFISPWLLHTVHCAIICSLVNLKGTLNRRDAIEGAEYIIVAVPTNYNADTNYFDTNTLELVIKEINEINSDSTIVIKSTIPVGYTSSLKIKFNYKNVFFSTMLQWKQCLHGHSLLRRRARYCIHPAYIHSTGPV